MTTTTTTGHVVGLVCTLTNDPNVQIDHPGRSSFEWLTPQEGKKSSFSLVPSPCTTTSCDDSSVRSIDKPAHVVLECRAYRTNPANTPQQQHSSQRLPFRFGGMEVTSNARNVEAYVMMDGERGTPQEEYLLTARGVPLNDDNQDEDNHFHDNHHHLHKSILISPSGPRTITRLHLKLLSLRPAKCTTATLHGMIVKGKLPDSMGVDASTTGTNSPVQVNEPTRLAVPARQDNHAKMSVCSVQDDNNNNNNNNNNISSSSSSVPAAPQTNHNDNSMSALSTNDIAAAMSGVSIMIKGVESRIQKSIRETVEGLEVRMRAHYLQQCTTLTERQIQIQQKRDEAEHSSMRLLVQEERKSHEATVERLLAQQQEKNDQSVELLERQQQRLEEQGALIRALQQQQTELVSVVQSLNLQLGEVSTQWSAWNRTTKQGLSVEESGGSVGHNEGRQENTEDCERDPLERASPAKVDASSSDEGKEAPRAAIMQRRHEPIEIPDLTPIPDQDLLGLDSE